MRGRSSSNFRRTTPSSLHGLPPNRCPRRLPRIRNRITMPPPWPPPHSPRPPTSIRAATDCACDPSIRPIARTCRGAKTASTSRRAPAPLPLRRASTSAICARPRDVAAPTCIWTTVPITRTSTWSCPKRRATSSDFRGGAASCRRWRARAALEMARTKLATVSASSMIPLLVFPMVVSGPKMTKLREKHRQARLIIRIPNTKRSTANSSAATLLADGGRKRMELTGALLRAVASADGRAVSSPLPL
mmetsp:Transcript_38922/g.93640  ORF Transcript_38922/g.93640 Transcript_38922/m.93640 type:complete len:247 (-) Transcript_38922:569-1309(-)